MSDEMPWVETPTIAEFQVEALTLDDWVRSRVSNGSSSRAVVLALLANAVGHSQPYSEHFGANMTEWSHAEQIHGWAGELCEWVRQNLVEQSALFDGPI